MPIYEYKCNQCGVFEVTQRITDKALKKCPSCKGRVERIISNTSFVLKGTGWYVTDYAKRGSGTPSGTESAGSDGESKSAETAGNTANGKSQGTEKPAPSTAAPSSPAASSSADKSAD